MLNAEPGNPEALRAMGSACRRLGLDRQAEEYYRRLIGLDPGSQEHHLDLALIARDRGDLVRAEEEMRHYLNARPDDENARLLLGGIYERQSHHRHAAQVFQEILEANPGNLEAHRALARLHREEGEPEKALPLLERVMALEGAGSGDLDGLRGTLQLYEETVSAFSGDRRLSWDRSLQALKDLALESSRREEAEEEGLEEPLLDELPAPEEDAVPIIHIGDREPVLKVEEQEEEVRLEEESEEWPEEEAVEIRDERAPSLFNLLKDEDLYPEELRHTARAAGGSAGQPASGTAPPGGRGPAASLSRPLPPRRCALPAGGIRAGRVAARFGAGPVGVDPPAAGGPARPAAAHDAAWWCPSPTLPPPGPRSPRPFAAEPPAACRKRRDCPASPPIRRRRGPRHPQRRRARERLRTRPLRKRKPRRRPRPPSSRPVRGGGSRRAAGGLRPSRTAGDAGPRLPDRAP